MEHFRSYVGGQKVLIETCHKPVTFLNSQRLREGRVSNSRIASWMMALQGYDIEVKYAQNHKMALGQGLAECQHCDCDEQPSLQSLLVTHPFPCMRPTGLTARNDRVLEKGQGPFPNLWWG